MVIMMINNDNDNKNANDGNGDQAITIFQTKHFREPVTSDKPRFLVLTHVLVYGYWYCQVTILSAYNAPLIFSL